jgi:hypothetical protein
MAAVLPELKQTGPKWKKMCNSGLLDKFLFALKNILDVP